MDQLTHPALVLLTARPEQFAFMGSINATWRHRNGRTFGPYYRLRYREGGRSCSIYLGRPGPLVDRVRQTLYSLQKPLRQHRALLAVRRQVREALRHDRRQVDAHLRRLGLRLKGFEVRGWRTSPVRWLARLTPTHRSAFAPFRIEPFRLPSVRRLRFIPRGLALQWFLDQHPRAPRSPQARVLAVIDWRKRSRVRACTHAQTATLSPRRQL